MQNNKIGERVALFWIAWAYVAEKALNYKLADQIFQKGKFLASRSSDRFGLLTFHLYAYDPTFLLVLRVPQLCAGALSPKTCSTAATSSFSAAWPACT